MPKIRKFNGYLVEPERATNVVTPAYDAMLPSERREFAGLYPGNYVNVMRSLDEFDGSGLTLEEILHHNQSHLNQLLDNGAFLNTSSPAYYLYKLRAGQHEQIGVIADIPVNEYTQGRLKKHEDTQLEKENMLTRYQEAVGVTSSPICVAYADRSDIDDAIQQATQDEPYLKLTAWDDVAQTVWKVSDPALSAQLEQGFADIEYTYLTDGHHRCASGARFAEIVKQRAAGVDECPNSDHLLVALFPDSQLRIFSYFRCVRDLDGMDESELIAAIAATGIEVRHKDSRDLDALLPTRSRDITMIVDDSVYGLRIPAAMVPSDDPAGSLDVSILQERILASVLGIHNARSDERLSYAPGVEGIAGLMERCKKDWRLGFACVNTTIQEVIEVADAGQVMPPKSTWFDPKLRAGIFLRYC